LKAVATKIVRDEVIGVMNIDDKGLSAGPRWSIFSSGGLLTRIDLGEVPPFACQHYLLRNFHLEDWARDLSLRPG